MSESVIDLPESLVWLDGDKLGVAIVQGDRREYPRNTGNATATWVDAPQVWEQYDKRFDPPFVLAGDSMFAQDPTSDDNGLTEVCRDGRQVWTVRLGECEVCGGGEFLTDDDECLNCQGGYLSARATIQVVPVYGDLDDEPDHDHIYLMGGQAYLYLMEDTREWQETRLAVDPLPQPGRDWAVIVRLVDAAERVRR